MFTVERHRWVVDVGGLDVLVYVGQVSWLGSVYGGDRGHPVWGPVVRSFQRNHCAVVHSLQAPKRVLWHGEAKEQEEAAAEAEQVVAGLRSGSWHWATAATTTSGVQRALRRWTGRRERRAGVRRSCQASTGSNRASFSASGAWKAAIHWSRSLRRIGASFQGGAGFRASMRRQSSSTGTSR